MRSWSAFLLSVLVAIAIPAASSPWAPSSARAQQGAPTLDELLARFGRIEGMELAFREEKRIALMSRPAQSAGTLHYARPSRLVRRVTSPREQVVLIDAGELRMRDGERVERIDLASQPVLRSFVETFSQLLRGDRAALEQTYRVRYETTDGGWTLTLTPRGAPLDQLLRELRFEGAGTSLRGMVATETNGDTTTTTFTQVDVARRYTTAEAARLFSLGTGPR